MKFQKAVPYNVYFGRGRGGGRENGTKLVWLCVIYNGDTWLKITHLSESSLEVSGPEHSIAGYVQLD